MFINKKITAIFAALTMIATTFTAITVVSADELPSLTAEYVDKANLVVDEEADFGIKFTVNNLVKGCDTLAFKIDVPGNLLQVSVNEGTSKKPKWVMKPVITETAAESAAGAEEASIFYENPFAKVMLSEDDGTMYKFTYAWSAPTSGELLENGATFELDFYYADGKTMADMPVGSFAIEGVEYRYKGDAATIKQANDQITVVNNAEVKKVDETTPVITPAEGQSDYDAAAAFTGYAAATKVGNYTGDDNADDKATAFKATVSGTSSTGDVIWKVTDGVDTKYHKMSTGATFAGEGSAIVGLAVEGLADGSASVAFLK